MSQGLEPTPPSALSRDTRTALRNAAKLTVSLGVTWGIGLVVRFWMPRHLGPERFGLLSFADGLAATALGCAGLGIDAYIQKEIPVRPQLASGFYGGTLLLRVVLSAVLVAALLLLPLGQRSPQVRELLVLFGVGHLLFSLNGSLAALLQANGTVDELAVANVVAKLVWGLGMGAGILAHWPLTAFATVFAASEALKVLIVQRSARRTLGLTFRLDRGATRAALAASLGFYAHAVAQALGWRLDVAMLGLLAHDTDVGWYGASQTLAGITLLLAPILSAVLAPLYSRALERSPEEMVQVLRRALEGILALTVPVALVLGLGAELWTRLAFGAAFAPGAGSLRTLAPLFVLIYVSILLATAVMIQGRGWRLSGISIAGIAVHVAFALYLVPAFGSWLGPGGAGTGMALALVAKECIVVSALLSAVGSQVIDPRRRRVLARTFVAALLTVALHWALAPLGPWRLAIDLPAYCILVIRFGAVRPNDLVRLVRELIPGRS